MKSHRNTGGLAFRSEGKNCTGISWGLSIVAKSGDERLYSGLDGGARFLLVVCESVDEFKDQRNI